MNVKMDSGHVVEITGMNHDGQGVGRIDGFTVFVDGALTGEKAEILVTSVKKAYATGRLIRIIEPSCNRVTPFCSAYNLCGGCNLQHLDYNAQLRFKTNLVKETLERIGRIGRDVIIHDTIGMSNPLYYRNKAQYPAGMTGSVPVIGFFAAKSHSIIENSSCNILDLVNDKVKEVMREFITRYKINTYDEARDSGLIRHIVTRTGVGTGEVMVIIVINMKMPYTGAGDQSAVTVKRTGLPQQQKLIEMLVSAVPGIKSIILNVNTQKANVVLGETNITIFGSDFITDYIGKYRFKISPLSFYQVNPGQTEVLYGKVLEYAGLTGKETVIDLYCGIGTISLFLSEKASKVYGIEIIADAIRDARENALINGVDNVEFITGEVEKVLPSLYDSGVRADAVVVDPPRKGCDEALLKVIADMKPERMIYVSCNPSTLARDLKYLGENGYAATEVQPVDMFPWTTHVECVVGMQRKDA